MSTGELCRKNRKKKAEQKAEEEIKAILCPGWNVHRMNPCDLCDVGGADLCNPRGVSAVGSQAGFNLQPLASGGLQSEGISGWEADVSPRLLCHPARHSIGRQPEGRVIMYGASVTLLMWRAEGVPGCLQEATQCEDC